MRVAHTAVEEVSRKSDALEKNTPKELALLKSISIKKIAELNGDPQKFPTNVTSFSRHDHIPSPLSNINTSGSEETTCCSSVPTIANPKSYVIGLLKLLFPHIWLFKFYLYI